MSKSRYVFIDGTKYNKTSFGKKWSEVTNSNQIGNVLSGGDRKFVDEVVSMIATFNLIKSKGEVKYKVVSKKFQAKAVKGIVMVSPNSKTEIWLGKAKIVDALFPKPAPVPLHKKTKQDVIAALRLLINPQIKAYKDSVRRQLNSSFRHKVKCALTGESISMGEYHIDHKYPFKNLVEDWCREIGKDLEHIDVVCRGTKCTLRQSELAESFYDYHMIHASLQVTTAKANLSKGAKYYG
jgi:hypothetical protein